MGTRWLAPAMLAGVFCVWGSAHADELVIDVPGDVDTVVLRCGGQELERRPRPSVVPGAQAQVRFPMWPGRECDVTFERHVGRVMQLGNWACSDGGGCSEQGSNAAPAPPLPPGQIKVLTTDRLPHSTLELVCPGGYRVRTAVTNHTALFTGVPSEECELFFKGGAPYRYRPVTEGTWSCTVVAGTAVCEAR